MFVYQRQWVCAFIVVSLLNWKLFVPTYLCSCILHHELLSFIHLRVELLWLRCIKASFHIRFVWFLDVASSVLSWSIYFGIVIEIVIEQSICISFQRIRSSFWRLITKSRSIVCLRKRIIETWILSQVLDDVSFFANLDSNAWVIGSRSTWFISSALLLFDILFTLEVRWAEVVLSPINLFVFVTVSFVF